MRAPSGRGKGAGDLVDVRPDQETRRRSALLGLGGIAALCAALPYLLGGHHTRVRAWDNLDSNWVWFVLQDRAHTLTRFGGEVGSILGGVPAEALGSDLYVPRLLVGAFGLVAGYVITQVLVHTVAYVGMVRLLDRLLGRDQQWVNVGVAVVFAWVPFWPPAALTIAGLPLLASAYLAARKGQARWWDWAVLVMVPFASITVYSAPFVGALIAADLLWARARTGHTAGRAARALIVYVTAAAVVEVELIARTLFNPWETHRLEWAADTYGPGGLVRDVGDRLVHGTPHTWAGHGVLLLAVVAFGLIVARRADRRLLIGASVATVVLLGLSTVEHLAVVDALRGHLGPLGTLQWRFDWLVPPILFVAFAAGLAQLSRLDRRVGGALVAGVLALQLVNVVHRSEWNDSRNLTFDEFYAPALFAEIRQDLDLQPGERVGSVGLHPALAQLAGLPTVDGYLTNYPVERKHAFRRIIADELEASASLRSYFDDWGSRAYLFTASLPATVDQPAGLPAEAHLAFDLAAFRDLGGRYLLASVPIDNARALGLDLVGVYEDEQTPWTVQVYEVD